MTTPQELGAALLSLAPYTKNEPNGGGFTIESFKRGGLMVTITEISDDGRKYRTASAGTPGLDQLPDAIREAIELCAFAHWSVG